MPVHTLPASEAIKRLDSFDEIIDARTEDEFALDHVPGAINWPTLDSQERITIGTMYKQVNPFEAKKRGAALSARNIADHIERFVIDKPRDWKPLVYCWRGGNRSGALATILGAIGFHVTLIEGGYRSWRASLVDDIARIAPRFQYRVICGPTGSGKTRLLKSLSALGAQALDLEDLACHRSSVLGHIPGVPQPSQKHFDSLIWDFLRQLDPSRPVFVESESKKVGNVRVPDALIEAMRGSPCVDVQLPDDERVELLLEDYPFFVTDTDLFCQRLDALVQRRGHEAVDGWKEDARNGKTRAVVKALLTDHYDPMYAASIKRNFTQYSQAWPCEVPSRTPEAMTKAATSMIRWAEKAQASTQS
ncbi:tRNA 2-selenouridine(34) synthase MnmH [Hydrogenophaga sp. 5NK40-0174]|uniref:tRNA 2-selenouridine(34) synthase MnmH n=1 Tax=Hydrogenophaga sp. 5NK40-0174 TaxID=3127649 RepID=UPI003108E28D